MAARFLSGVAVSVVLGLGMAFCIVDFIPRPKVKRPGSAVLPVHRAGPERSFPARRDGADSAPAPAARLEWPHKTRPEAQSLRQRTQASPTSPAYPTFPVPPAMPAPKQPPAPPSSLDLPPTRSPEAGAAPALSPQGHLQPSGQSRRKAAPAPMLPLRRMLMGRRDGTGSARGAGRRRNFPATTSTSAIAAASGTALANLADVREVDPTWDYYDLPEKGLDVWAEGKTFSATQKLRDAGLSSYELDGRAYSLGLRKDWSIDSVIGASIDILDAKLTSGAMLDYRTNDLAGYRVNVHYEGVAFDYLAFATKAFYGRLDGKGEGYLQIHHEGRSWREEWREDKHGSEMYGFAGKVGLPLLWGPDIKVLPEAGVNLTKLRSDAYSYVLSSDEHNERTFQTARADSTSLEIPLAVTFRKDMPQSWGVLTPLLGLAYTLELDDSATGVRTGNASAAAAVKPDPTGGAVSSAGFDASPKAFVRVDLGLELRTVGGWRMDARYQHIFAEKYTNDTFKLELGRCF